MVDLRPPSRSHVKREPKSTRSGWMIPRPRQFRGFTACAAVDAWKNIYLTPYARHLYRTNTVQDTK